MSCERLAAAHDLSPQVRALAPAALSFWLYEDDLQAALRQLAADSDPQVRLALARRLAEESALPHVGRALRFLDEHFDPHGCDLQLQRALDQVRGRALAQAAHHGSEADLARVARWIPHLTTLAAGDVQFMAQVPPGRRLLAALCQAPCPEVRGIAQQVAAGLRGAR